MLVFAAFVAGTCVGILDAVFLTINAATTEPDTATDPVGHVIHLGLPRELRWFFVAGAVVGAVVAVGCAVRALGIWRRGRRRLGWGFLIAVPMIPVVGIPIGLAGATAGIAAAKVAGLTSSPSSGDYLDLVNDTSATVQVRYCAKQECAGAASVTLRPGKSHRYDAPKDDPTPDEFVITGAGAGRRCELIPGLTPDETGPIELRVSGADADTC